MQAVIDKYAKLPFQYGQDCCQFVGECLEALTGKNPAAAFVYSSQAEALALIESYGDLEALITATLGAPYGGAKDGDVTVHDVQGGQQVAGIIYRGRSIVRTPNGVTDWPVSLARAVWRT